MLEFFHGWRRKAGCVTLVMAIAVFVVWMRSIVVADAVRFYQVGTVSQQGLFTWGDNLDGDDSLQLKSTFLVGGPYDGFFQYENEVPYWPVAAIFAIVSAYLILWKPRPKEPRDA